MALTLLSPTKIILLAVELASKADIEGLRSLAAQHGTILRKEILLRILLTYLPEAVPSHKYVHFIEEIDKGEYPELDAPADIDLAGVEKWSEEEATKKVRKLHLLKLANHETPPEAADDPTTLFLLRRAYKVDEEAGLLDALPDLLVPFLGHSPYIRTLMVSAVLPLMRRNFQYYPQSPIHETLHGFERLPDRTAVSLLMEEAGKDDLGTTGRDLKCLVGPWLYNEKRWATRTSDDMEEGATPGSVSETQLCPGWAQVLDWLTTQASQSWKVAVSAVDQWDGPGDVDLGGYGAMWLSEDEQQHLEHTYARAALASAYLIPEASAEALSGAHTIVTKIMGLLDHEPSLPLESAATHLPPVPANDVSSLLSPKHATYLRNDLLEESNPLTAPTKGATRLLHGLILSAYLLTRSGAPCTVRRAGELALLQDEREQKAEATRSIHTLSNTGPKTDDKYWIKTRNDILWLRDWGSEEDSTASGQIQGVFGQLKKEFLEVEILKALLANTRYTLARNLYENSSDKPLSEKVLQDTIFAAAYHAFDSASNPNRTRGGLKKCDDILKAFPKTISKSLPATKRIDSLLKATHALSTYRIVLKQGEPFTPVLLRVHSDPITTIAKILEQNPKSYTQLHDLLDLGSSMVSAGLVTQHNRPPTPPQTQLEQEANARLTAHRRITAMAIDQALTEDDFETAYSYVLTHLSSSPPQNHSSPPDDYSWKAALQTGKYRRNPRTIPPPARTGLTGSFSANPEIRHLEQRIECLSTALRIAPKQTLTEILNAFRRIEEELVVAVGQEEEMERRWDEKAENLTGESKRGAAMPGSFAPSPVAGRKPAAAAAAAGGRHSSVVATAEKGEDKPMSLFDLSRASVASAQKNLSALSSLQKSGLGRLAGGFGALGGGALGGGGGGAGGHAEVHTETPGSGAGSEDEGSLAQRTRKRDQLREAAMGTLVSGVGWLVGAPATPQPGTPGPGER